MFAGKTAIVTGAASGIGKATAELLLKNGAKSVIAADVAKIPMNDPKLHPAVLDVGDKKAIKEFWGLSREKLGQRAPDLLVNNAGITRDCSFGKMGEDQWDEMMRVNLSSIFHMSQSYYLWAREDKASCKTTPRAIVNLSSLSAKIGTFGQANYCAAKAGVYGITKNNAREMAPYNFRVNAVSPGTILTPMVMAMPEHIREATMVLGG